MTAAAGDSIECTLARIESRVLEDVWLGHRRFAGYGVLTLFQTAAAVMWASDALFDAPANGAGGVPAIASSVLAIASVCSGLALALRRFRWCCAAAYSCGLAGAVGVGAFWWVHTGRPGAALTWLVLADIAVVALTDLLAGRGRDADRAIPARHEDVVRRPARGAALARKLLTRGGFDHTCSQRHTYNSHRRSPGCRTPTTHPSLVQCSSSGHRTPRVTRRLRVPHGVSASREVAQTQAVRDDEERRERHGRRRRSTD